MSGLTLQTMGEPQAWAPYAALVLAAAGWIWTIIRRRGSPDTRMADDQKENRS
jgi:hypothetical protein